MSALSPIKLPPNTANFCSETIFYNIGAPDGKNYTVFPENWTDDWTMKGKPVEDGLPVLKVIIKSQHNYVHIVRPYHLFHTEGTEKDKPKYAGFPATREVQFISPKAAKLMNFTVREVDQEKSKEKGKTEFLVYRLEPVFKECFGPVRKTSYPPMPVGAGAKDEKKV